MAIEPEEKHGQPSTMIVGVGSHIGSDQLPKRHGASSPQEAWGLPN
jgi:hypothetical protein